MREHGFTNERGEFDQDAADAVLGPEENEADRVVARAAQLSPIEYDQQRHALADQINVRVITLDAEVEKARTGGDDRHKGQAVIFEDIDPWPDPMDGAEVLNATSAMFSRYVVLPSGGADACALWCVHAHAHDCFGVSPRLNFTSPEKGCGKTTALDVTALLTPRSIRTENITTAVLFRLVEEHCPTVLIDEVDTFLKNDDELRGALNAGHRRGGKALRCEGDQNDVRAFNVYAAVVMAGIRALPGTLHDRSIVIRLERAKPGELVEPFDYRRTGPAKELNRKLSRWAADHKRAIADSDPELPDGVHNRLADNWRPLFAIADVAGGDWPRRARAALAALIDKNGDDTISMTLLEDIRTILQGRDRIASTDLGEKLCEMEDRPWPEWGRSHKPITPNAVARLLKPFQIKPQTIRVGNGTCKGYLAEDFDDAFARYLYIQTVTPSQATDFKAFSDIQTVTRERGVTDANRRKPAPDNDCYGVTDRNGGVDANERESTEHDYVPGADYGLEDEEALL